MESLPLQKGNKLEKAVELIEHAILKTNPSLKEVTFVFEPKKIFIIDDIRHEIDLYVEIDLGHNYKSVFIFECKNWEEAVGKNEIIVFSEKIKATQAQRGYFIAKSFGKYAIAQAKLDLRIVLLKAGELPFEPFDLSNFHFIAPELKHIDINLGSKSFDPDNSPILNPSELTAELYGEPLNFLPYVNELGKSIMQERLDREPTGSLSQGTYDYEAEGEFDFEEGTLIVNGISIQKLKLGVKFSNAVLKPRLISSFDIESRGRIIQFESVIIGQGTQIGMSFVFPY
jgi:Restriction endonuclease